MLEDAVGRMAPVVALRRNAFMELANSYES
jgi:hypothetical protein